jgi:hypothetical protein
MGEKWDTMKTHISGVMSDWQVYEKAHGAARKSKGPKGRISNFLNRLYLWPALQKQIEYNAELARTVRELSNQLADLQARVAVQATLSAAMLSTPATPGDDISTELEDLRARIQGLEISERHRIKS